jgi:capsular exopolysaccharide synthesis family protein
LEEFNINKLISNSSNALTFKDHVNILKSNWIYILLICLVAFGASAVYSYLATDIYVSSTSIKISKPQESIISAPVLPGLRDMNLSSNMIRNEIQTIYNRSIREQVARTVIDSFIANPNKGYALLIDDEFGSKKKPSLKSYDDLLYTLRSSVSVVQIEDLDFIEISVESPSPEEAALIANSFANAYKEFNLLVNRNQLTQIRETLDTQRQEKRRELVEAENNIKSYQLRGGVIQLDAQARSLIDKLSEFESRMNTTKIDMTVSKETLDRLKKELEQRDPSMITHLESKSSEPYLKRLQEEIASLEAQRDFATINNPSITENSELIKNYNNRISELKNILNESIQKYQSLILSSSPEEIKQLIQKVFEEEIKYQSLNASYNQLGQVLNSYEEKFNSLPGRTLDLARLERERAVFEKLYLILEEKYQEALLNEQAIPGNVMIMNRAYPSAYPSKPNRKFIMILGAIVGLGLGYGFVYFKHYFNKTVKSPEDLERKNIKFLTWIPKMKDRSFNSSEEFLMLNDSESIIGESFRALRTRIQFSRTGSNTKLILITSAAPGEGKTLISLNLAGSFAKDEKKALIIDCDLRKPRLHTIMGESVSPGLTDYLFGKTQYENILRISKLPRLDYIPAGTFQKNPSEILNSRKMISLLQKLRDEYDIVILDTPPILAVADSEVLANFVDSSMLIASVNSTEIDWIKQAADLLNHEQSSFLGVVLNNYDFKMGYPSTYKYHGYYYSDENEPKKKKKKFKRITKSVS